MTFKVRKGGQWVSVTAKVREGNDWVATGEVGGTGSEVELTWTDNSTIETEFRIYRETNPDDDVEPEPTFPDDYTVLTAVDADTTTFTDTSPPDANAIWYAVTAANEDAESAATTDSTSGSDVTGFSWDQTYTDTSWLTDADAAGNLNVEVVTTTDLTASGGFEEAAESPSSTPNVVVFEVGGVIDLEGTTIDPPQGTWIAGETAPDPGITFIRGRIRTRSDNFIGTHFSCYRGDGVSAGDTVDPDGNDQLYDHVTALWGTDETTSVPNAVSRCSWINGITAESLYDANHSEGLHSRGFFVGSDSTTDFCLYGSIMAHNNRRNPFTRGDMVMISNYVYNFGGGEQNSGHIASFDSGGPDITAKAFYVEHGDSSDEEQDVFIHGSGGADLYPEDIVWTHNGDLTNGVPNIVDNPPQALPSGLDFENDPIPASETESFTKRLAGSRPANRPPVEQDLIDNRLSTGNRLIDSQDDVGGYPSYSTTTRSLDVPDNDIVDWIKTNFTAIVEDVT